MNACEKLMHIIGNAKGDDLERAQRAFAGQAMHQEHGNSGKTRGRIFAEYQAERAEWQEAHDLAAAVPDLLETCKSLLNIIESLPIGDQVSYTTEIEQAEAIIAQVE